MGVTECRRCLVRCLRNKRPSRHLAPSHTGGTPRGPRISMLLPGLNGVGRKWLFISHRALHWQLAVPSLRFGGAGGAPHSWPFPGWSLLTQTPDPRHRMTWSCKRDVARAEQCTVTMPHARTEDGRLLVSPAEHGYSRPPPRDGGLPTGSFVRGNGARTPPESGACMRKVCNVGARAKAAVAWAAAAY